MAGPFGIEQVDVPGLLGAYQGAQDRVNAQQERRVNQMLLQRKIDAEDRALEQQHTISGIWKNYVTPGQGGSTSTGGMAGAYSAPAPAQPAAPIAAPVTSPLLAAASAPPVPAPAVPSVPAAAASPTAPGAAPATPSFPTPDPKTITPQDQSFVAANEAGIRQLMGLNPEQGMAFLKFAQGMDADKRAKFADAQDALVTLGYSTKQMPYDQRKAFIQQHAQDLMAAHPGMTPEMVSKFDPTDQNIDSAVAGSLGIKGILDHAEKTATADETKRHNLATEAQASLEHVPVYDDAGNKIGEQIVQVGAGGGGQASGGGGANSAPRSVRNNNPGNLKASSFTKSQPGYQSTDSGGFAVFDSPESGAKAQAALLGSYIDRGYNTVQKIINRWAPPGDNNDTSAYIGTVAKALNVNPNDTISKALIPKLQSAISTVEGGSSASNAGPAKSASGNVVFQTTPVPSKMAGFDGATIDFYAQKVAAGGDLPTLGMGKEATAMRQAILAKAASIQSGQGVTGADSNLRHADVKTSTMALGQLQKTRTNIEAFERTAQMNIEQARMLAPKALAGSAPVFNRWIQAGRKGISGDADLTKFNVAVNTVANEYAKIMSGASGGAVTSDSARKEAMDILNNAQTPQGFEGALKQMQIDMHNRQQSLVEQEGRLRSNILGNGVTGSGAKPPPPVGTVRNGWKFNGGNPADPKSWDKAS